MNLATRIILTARTALRLGIGNVAAAAAHRVAQQVRPFQLAPLEVPAGPIFRSSDISAPIVADPGATIARARRISAGELEIFGGGWVQLGSPYAWDRNVLPARECEDVKGLWEASRFIWAVDLARAHRLAPDKGFLDDLERFSRDWVTRHASCHGINWSCGQEASIRLLHLLLANYILCGSSEMTASMAAIVEQHARRIERTLEYAMAQDNNHATSEAAALFIAGGILLSRKTDHKHLDAAHWHDLGRKKLEQLTAHLIMEDGGFSQYSVNYHRLLLDTLCQVEFWRRQLRAPSFSVGFGTRVEKAIRWLGALTNAASGRAPNLGHNDGAHIYRLTDGPFSDHRPTLSLASALFIGKALPSLAHVSAPLAWLNISEPSEKDPTLLAKATRSFPNWGLSLLNPRADGSGAYAFVRYPILRFRPAQADMLHFDLWTETGENLLIDAGSFSYAHPDGRAHFSSIKAHNSIEFDGDEPMRSLGKFLYADWPDGESDVPIQQNGSLHWMTHYRDYRGIEHRRYVSAEGEHWTVRDTFSGFKREAVLRWHLPEQAVRFEGQTINAAALSLRLDGNASIALKLEEGSVSPTYGIKEPSIVISAAVPAGASEISTIIDLEGI